jgi:hypothetical protein
VADRVAQARPRDLEGLRKLPLGGQAVAGRELAFADHAQQVGDDRVSELSAFDRQVRFEHVASPRGRSSDGQTNPR